MGDLPHPPKLKLTPRQRAFLAGEIYPPDEPYEQPKLDEETRQRNLQGIADARAALHSKKPYNEGTQGQWPGMSVTRSETSRARLIRQQKQRQAAERDLVEEAEQGGIPLVTTFDQAEQAMLSASNQGTVPHPGNPRPDSIHQRPKMNIVEGLEEFNEQNLLWEEGVAGQWFYDVNPSPTDYFKAGTHGQGMGPIYSNYGSSGFSAPAVTTPKKAGPPPPGATSSRPVEDKPPTLSNRSYFSSGTQGQQYPKPRPMLPKKETETGKQIKGALSGVAEGLADLFGEKEKKEPPKRERPVVKMKDPYSEAGTEGQKIRQPGRKQPKKRPSPKDRSHEPARQQPRIDKTTTYDTLTREELLRLREEEAERERNKPPPGTYKP
tara:strand:+ start:1886 stop:3022 length:1137 start_codon:yes stop_codon:yes gene_type:complete